MKATNFRFDEKTTELLDELRRKNNTATKSEVVRKALALLDIASDAKNNGDKILIVNQDGTSQREVLLW